jgi:hypothetical protein
MDGIRVSRRRFVSSGVVASGLLSTGRKGLGEDVCVLTAEQEEGPFYLDRPTMRKAIAEERAGVPLTIRLVLQNSQTCATPTA